MAYCNSGHCCCDKHRGIRRYHYHRVFADGLIDPRPFGSVFDAEIYGMAFQPRKIQSYIRVDLLANSKEECGICSCSD